MSPETAISQTAPIQVAKLNVRSMGCEPKVAAALPDAYRSKVIALAMMYGIVTGLEEGETDIGDYMAITGRFQGQNIQDVVRDTDGNQLAAGSEQFGKVFESGTVFLPPGMHDVVIAKCREIGLVKQNDGDKRTKRIKYLLKDSKEVKFGLEIGVRKDANASGITYQGTPLFEPTENDPLTEMRRLANETRQNLLAATRQMQLAQAAPAQLEAGQHQGPANGKKK